MKNEVRGRGAFTSTLSCLLVCEFLCQPHIHSSFREQLNMWPYWFMSHFQLVFAIVFLKVVYLFHRAYYVHRRLACSLSLWLSEVQNYTESLLKNHHVGPERGLIQPTQTWLSPGAPLFTLTKAAHRESLYGHRAALWSPCHRAALEKWQQPGRLPSWLLVDWAPRQGHKTCRREKWGRSERRIYILNYAFRNITNKRLGAGENLHSNRIFLDFFSECT